MVREELIIERDVGQDVSEDQLRLGTVGRLYTGSCEGGGRPFRRARQRVRDAIQGPVKALSAFRTSAREDRPGRATPEPHDPRNWVY